MLYNVRQSYMTWSTESDRPIRTRESASGEYIVLFSPSLVLFEERERELWTPRVAVVACRYHQAV